MNTIIGIFDDPMGARRAMEALRNGQLQLDDISVVTRSADTDTTAGISEDVSAGEGAAVGAVWGGLVGLAALLIPGVGPFVAGGALFAALTGAVTGAVVGGIAAALIDFSGIPEEDARGYEEQIRAGKTLVAVKARAEDSAEVRRILTSSGADAVGDKQTPVRAAAPAPTAATAATMPSGPVIRMYDERGRRVEQEREYGAAASTTMRRHGIYDAP